MAEHYLTPVHQRSAGDSTLYEIGSELLSDEPNMPSTSNPPASVQSPRVQERSEEPSPAPRDLTRARVLRDKSKGKRNFSPVRRTFPAPGNFKRCTSPYGSMGGPLGAKAGARATSPAASLPNGSTRLTFSPSSPCLKGGGADPHCPDPTLRSGTPKSIRLLGLGGHLCNPDPSTSTTADELGYPTKPPRRSESPSDGKLVQEDNSAKPAEPFKPISNRVIMADVPPSATVTFDLLSPCNKASTERCFHHNLHGLHMACVSAYELACPASAYFFFSKHTHNGSMCILQWNDYIQTLGYHQVGVVERDLTASAAEKFPAGEKTPTEAMRDDEHAGLWTMLTSRLDQDAFARMTRGIVEGWQVKSSDPVRDIADGLNSLEKGRRQGLGFSGTLICTEYTKIAAQADRDSAKTDNTDILATAIKTRGGGVDHFVAEMQFLFIIGILVANVKGMTTWIQMVRGLVLRSPDLLVANPDVAWDLLECVDYQLSYLVRLESDALPDILKINMKSCSEAAETFDKRIEMLYLGDFCSAQMRSLSRKVNQRLIDLSDVQGPRRELPLKHLPPLKTLKRTPSSILGFMARGAGFLWMVKQHRQQDRGGSAGQAWQARLAKLHRRSMPGFSSKRQDRFIMSDNDGADAREDVHDLIVAKDPVSAAG